MLPNPAKAGFCALVAANSFAGARAGMRYSVLMALCRRQVFRTGKAARQLAWLVNQDGKMLRANPRISISKLQRNQGYLLATALAV
jgi:hypothetical protein